VVEPPTIPAPDEVGEFDDMRLRPAWVAFLRRTALVGVVVLAVVIAAGGRGRVAATSVASATRANPGATSQATPAGTIRHVVVIYQENHSFDETLGKLCQLHAGRCDGYVGPVRLEDGSVVRMTQSADVVPGVAHNVDAQDTAINGGAMDGWNHVIGCRAHDHYQCLTYYTPNQIPNLAALADKFVISDRTFSMADSPSWGGHVYAAAASVDNFTGDNPLAEADVTAGPGWGCNSMKLASWVDPTTHRTSMQPSCIPARAGTLDPTKYPYNGPFRATAARWVPTIFDRLEAKQLSWKLYSQADSVWSICPSFAECEYGPQHINLVDPAQFANDAKADTLPSYSVLLPGNGGNSQHNGDSMLAGDNYIGNAFATLEQSASWSSTAVFITYDDCGCFYDHVAPGTNPDGTRQGIRVPMVIVSPYAKVSFTDSQPATFASILKFTEETFGLSALSANDLNAYDFANSFDFTAAPTGPRIALSSQPLSPATKQFLRAHPTNANDPT
jgi:phospholipase C